MTGLELGKEIKTLQPQVNVIFCTGYDDYALEAIGQVRCNGYVMKPVTTEDIKKELDNLRTPLMIQKKRRTEKLCIYCFGNFEVFVDGQPLKFERNKTKELFAYLIDRNGAICKNGEIEAVLWEDDEDHSSYLKKCKKDLVDTLSSKELNDIFIQHWGGMGIDKSNMFCDYYEWREGHIEGIRSFNGEYMEQYSWAELTKAALLN